MKTTITMNKSRLTTLIAALALAACALLTVGCSEDHKSPTASNNSNSTSPADVVGSWAYSTVTADGTPVALDVALDWYSNTDEARLSFDAAGNISYTEYDGSGTPLYVEAGTYSLSGGSYSASFTSSSPNLGYTPYSTSGTWSISGSTMTLRFVEGGYNVVVTLLKM